MKRARPVYHRRKLRSGKVIHINKDVKKKVRRKRTNSENRLTQFNKPLYSMTSEEFQSFLEASKDTGVLDQITRDVPRKRNYGFAPGVKHLMRSKRSNTQRLVDDLDDMRDRQKSPDAEIVQLAKQEELQFKQRNPSLYNRVEREYLSQKIEEEFQEKYGSAKDAYRIGDFK